MLPLNHDVLQAKIESFLPYFKLYSFDDPYYSVKLRELYDYIYKAADDSISDNALDNYIIKAGEMLSAFVSKHQYPY